jgi:hypothetical protein
MLGDIVTSGRGFAHHALLQIACEVAWKKKVGHSEFQRYLRNVPAVIRLYGRYGWLCADERWAR